MKLRDVPLAFLPTFEAAGRLGSFAAAASELHLTPSAISQQIRALEDALGVTLFERTGRTAALTPDGEAYLAEVQDALRGLVTSTMRLRRRSRESVLRLSTVSIAAHEFLLPRLRDFHARFPGIELRIESSNQLIDFKQSDFDAALRVGHGWPELRVHPLGTAQAAPVCAPKLARVITTTSDLCDHTLLDPSGDGACCLRLALEQRGLAPLRAARTWHFETCFESLRAAEHGLGVAFAVFPLATHYVQSGRLAVPLADRVQLPGHVSFVHRPHDERFPFEDIASWLHDQYRALPQLPDGRVMPQA